MRINYKILSLLLFVAVVSCNDVTLPGNDTSLDNVQPAVPEEAVRGELLVKFVPEMEDILDRIQPGNSVATRSGIPSTDEVLAILGAYRKPERKPWSTPKPPSP